MYEYPPPPFFFVVQGYTYFHDFTESAAFIKQINRVVFIVAVAGTHKLRCSAK